MLPSIFIFGREIPLYGIIGSIGIGIAILFGVFYFSRYYDIKKDDVFYCTLFALIGIGIGAKLLYIITIIPSLSDIINNLGWEETLIRIVQGGFVFYGGLAGGVLGVYVYAKMFKLSFKKLIMILLPTIPIFHAIGRIGCLCAGCCYGTEYHGFGQVIFYSNKYSNVPIGIPLFPTQIVESICNLIIFIIILVTYKKCVGTYKTIAFYAISYSIVRFILEFYRGDAVRGILLGLSTSQWISIILFMIGIGLFIYENEKERRCKNGGEKNK